jgi:hypothetical protein
MRGRSSEEGGRRKLGKECKTAGREGKGGFPLLEGEPGVIQFDARGRGGPGRWGVHVSCSRLNPGRLSVASRVNLAGAHCNQDLSPSLTQRNLQEGMRRR